MALLKSLISWVGGKKALRELIYQRFPKNYGRYIEVFGGGGREHVYGGTHTSVCKSRPCGERAGRGRASRDDPYPEGSGAFGK